MCQIRDDKRSFRAQGGLNNVGCGLFDGLGLQNFQPRFSISFNQRAQLSLRFLNSLLLLSHFKSNIQ